jgi:hypothetical protein
LGIVISVVALVVVLNRVDLAAVSQVLAGTDPTFVMAVLGATCVDLTVRTLRWQVLLAPIRRVAFVHTLGYLLIGYLANNLLPGRVGELVRSHYVGDREGFSRASALGTIVVERTLDVAVLVVIASGAILILDIRGAVATAVLVGLGLAGLLIAAIGVALVAHRMPFADKLSSLVDRWPTVRRVAGRLRTGVAVAGKPRTLAGATAWTFVAWAATVVGVVAAAHAVGVSLTWSEATLWASGVALSMVIPAGPGNLGTYELAGVQIAAMFGIPADEAFGMTILVHVSVIFITSLGGAVALLSLGWRRREDMEQRDG